MEESEKEKILSGDNRLLVGGLIYLLAISLFIWLGYAWRMISIQRQNSKIKSIKAEVYSQISEDELSQLENRVGKLSTLYGQPVASKIFADIEKSVPKNVVLSSVQIERGRLVVSGTASDMRSVPLFATALSEQSSLLDSVEIKSASQTVEGDKVVISFVLESKL